jgi:peptide/nickel transport system substrate-binding protein
MSESRLVTNQLASAWKSIGARAEIKLETSDDLQRSIGSREYDALLYGVSIGVDPDVFVYWHSSQNDARSSGLNFSEYKNKAADTALEAGRTRTDPAIRVIKYKPFLQTWQSDVPALGLYQPRYLYLTHGKVFGLNEHVLNGITDHYNNVSNWEIRQVETTE